MFALRSRALPTLPAHAPGADWGSPHAGLGGPGVGCLLGAIFHTVDAASNLLQQQIDRQVSGDAAGANALTPAVSAAANDANTALSAYGLTACEENWPAQRSRTPVASR